MHKIKEISGYQTKANQPFLPTEIVGKWKDNDKRKRKKKSKDKNKDKAGELKKVNTKRSLSTAIKKNNSKTSRKLKRKKKKFTKGKTEETDRKQKKKKDIPINFEIFAGKFETEEQTKKFQSKKEGDQVKEALKEIKKITGDNHHLDSENEGLKKIVDKKVKAIWDEAKKGQKERDNMRIREMEAELHKLEAVVEQIESRLSNYFSAKGKTERS